MDKSIAKLPITVTIETINAGRHLEELFESVLPYVEDMFIVDSRSTDNTVDLCLKYGVIACCVHEKNI